MSWYTDPQLFIWLQGTRRTRMCRITQKLEVGVEVSTDVLNKEEGDYSFSKHFFLGSNKESDYSAFFSDLARKTVTGILFINSEGWMVSYSNQRDRYILSRVDQDSPFYKMPSFGALWKGEQDRHKAEKLALETKVSNSETTLKDKEKKWTTAINTSKKEVSDLKIELEKEKKDKEALQKKVSHSETMIATSKNNEKRLTEQVSDLQQQLKREKNDKEAFEKQISELTLKLEETCGVGSGGSTDSKQPWMIGQSVPCNWVSFQELQVRMSPKDTPLTYTNVMGMPKFSKDNTTNINVNRFSIGISPIVVVNVAELNPNNRCARFDPEIWSLYEYEGTCYAARKPFESEMLVEARRTC